MSATQIATLTTADTTPDTTTDNANGLSFEVHEIEYEDDSVPSVCHGYSSGGGGANTFSQKNIPGIPELEDYDHSPQADSPTSPFPLTRSTSSSLTSPTATATATATENLPNPSFQCSPAMATTDEMFAPPPPTPAIRTHPNVKRLEFGENPETIATLKFLESQRIDTTALVTQHIAKYGSRARIAQTCDGEVVGFAMFDNEIDQEQLRDMATYTHPKEIRQYVDAKPFIFLQLLMMDPRFVASTTTGSEWKKELIAQFCDCVTKNGKIAIARTETENQSEIEFYRECGFFTMQDMGIPSYPSSKGTDISVLAYTPMGKEGTTEIFKKFYSMGARF
jgi:hypothetical protein